MGTKNNPGKFDCYKAADPDEPMFILLARDRHAPALVEMWAQMRRATGEDKTKVTEAIDCAAAMRAWRLDCCIFCGMHGKHKPGCEMIMR